MNNNNDNECRKGDNERIEKLVSLLFTCIYHGFFVPL